MISIYAIYKAGENIPDAQAAMRPSLPRISCRASNSDSLYPTGGGKPSPRFKNAPVSASSTTAFFPLPLLRGSNAAPQRPAKIFQQAYKSLM